MTVAYVCNFSQFNFFLNNNFGTYFLTFWLFGLTLVPLGFVINAIVRKSNSSAAVGFLVFLFSFLFGRRAATWLAPPYEGHQYEGSTK